MGDEHEWDGKKKRTVVLQDCTPVVGTYYLTLEWGVRIPTGIDQYCCTVVVKGSRPKQAVARPFGKHGAETVGRRLCRTRPGKTEGAGLCRMVLNPPRLFCFVPFFCDVMCIPWFVLLVVTEP